MSITAADFIGTWRLVEYAFVYEDGTCDKPWGEEVHGLLLYSAEGYMSGNLSPARSKRAAMKNAARRQRGTRDYIAYSGRYTVAGHTVTHHVEVSLFPNWVGQPQVRFYSLDGDRLVLRTPPLDSEQGSVTAQLTWQRVTGSR